MPRVTMDVSLDDLKTMVLQLSPPDLLTLADTVETRAETINMMQLAETGFQEWNDPEEDIYHAET